MGNILQVRPPNPSISHCSKLAEARATENRRQTNRSLTAQSTSPIPQGPWKKGSAGPGAQQVIVHALGRAWAFLEDFGIKLPVINSHWPQFSYEGRNPKAPEKKNTMFHIKRSGMIINRELPSNWSKKKGILGLARDNL